MLQNTPSWLQHRPLQFGLKQLQNSLMIQIGPSISVVLMMCIRHSSSQTVAAPRWGQTVHVPRL